MAAAIVLAFFRVTARRRVIPGVLLLFGAGAVAGSGALSLARSLCAFTGAGDWRLHQLFRRL